MCEAKKITSIERQAKRSDRYSVFLDGEFAFGIHEDVLIKSGIAKGDLLNETQIENIIEKETRRKAKEKSFRLLSVRARSRKELVDRLKMAKFSQPVIDSVLEDLEKLNLINDSDFAKIYARSRMVTRPAGEFLLRQELKQKGVSEKDVESGVEEAYREKSEQTLARELAVKRKKRLASVEETKAKKRMSDFLLRRGFSWDIVKDIIENWDNLSIETE